MVLLKCLLYYLNWMLLYKLILTSKLMDDNESKKNLFETKKDDFSEKCDIFDVKQTRRHNMMCQMICQKLDMVMGVSIKGTLILCCCWALIYLHPIQNLIRQLATRNSRFSFCNIQNFNATYPMLKLVTL